MRATEIRGMRPGTCDRVPGSRRVADNTRVGLRATLSDLGSMINVTVCFGGRPGQRRSNVEIVSASPFFEF